MRPFAIMQGRNLAVGEPHQGHSPPGSELAGKVSHMVDIVIKAQFGYGPIDVSDPWLVTAGDVGLLRWRTHRRHPRFLEPVVVWDKDPSRRARKCIVSSLTVAGFQSKHTRLLVSFRSR
jgi:hypothetical protein